ncbi:MAG: F0F1 ATP synthase subunit B [Magnetococcus sp. DMHC-6]
MISAAYASESTGLPQFQTSTFSSQIFWTVVSFIVLMTLLKKYVIPAINNILEARGRQISDDLSEAEKKRKEADALLIEYKENLAQAGRVAAQALEDARLEAARIRTTAIHELTDELAQKKNLAMAEIEQAKLKALTEVQAVAIEVAMLATEKLIAKSVTKMDANKMVQTALEQIQADSRHLH